MAYAHNAGCSSIVPVNAYEKQFNRFSSFTIGTAVKPHGKIWQSLEEGFIELRSKNIYTTVEAAELLVVVIYKKVGVSSNLTKFKKLLYLHLK